MAELPRDAITNEIAFEYIKDSIDRFPGLDFFIYATSGREGDAPMLRKQMKFFCEQTDVFSYGNDPETNNIYYSISDFKHNDWCVPYSFYNTLPLFF